MLLVPRLRGIILWTLRFGDEVRDPGELFDWDLLAGHRLALGRPRVAMPSPYENDGAFFLALERFGYDIADGRAAIAAFQRRWRPRCIDGELDGEIARAKQQPKPKPVIVHKEQEVLW